MSGFKHLHFGGLAVVVALAAGQGCAAVSYQDAKTLGKGNVEFTPTLSRVRDSDQRSGQDLGTAYGGLIATGVSDKVDLMAGYQRFEIKDFDTGVNFAGLGAKFSLAKDRAALLLPASFAFGNDLEFSDTLQVTPTAVFSVPLGKTVTFNPAARLVWSNCDGCDVLVGGSAGLSVPFSSAKVVLRPEVGFLKNPGESGTIWTFGVGLSLRTR